MSDSPAAPTPPDPNVVANAQTKTNIDTANANATINRTNQVTPWGNLTYTKTPGEKTFNQDSYNADIAKYNEYQGQLAQQNQYQNQYRSQDNDGGEGVSNGPIVNPPGTYANGSAIGQAPDKANYWTNPVDSWTSTMTLDPAQQGLLNSSNKISQSMADLSQNQINNVANTINKPLDFNGLPKINNGFIQHGIDTTGVGDYQNSVVAGHLQHGANYGKIQDNLDTSGVPALVGGDQLSEAMRQQQQAAFNQQKAYLDPQYGQMQHDLENKLVQQGVMQNSDAWNRAMDDQGRQRTQAYQNANDNSVALGNAAQAQLYGQGLSSNQNAFNQALGSGNFANSAQAQGFGQAMSNAQLNNAAQAQEFGQAFNNAQLNNAVVGSKFGQAQAQQQVNNASQDQQFNQSMGARNQGLNELMTQQQNPLNVLNSLRTGAQVTSPTFGNTPQVNMPGVDMAGIMNNQFQAQMGAYNGQVSQSNSATQGVVGIAAAAAAAY